MPNDLIAKAYKSIQASRDDHDRNCRYKGKAVQVDMNPADAERIGFEDGEEVCGLTLKVTERQRAGHVRVWCDVELHGQGAPEEHTETASTHTLQPVGS